MALSKSTVDTSDVPLSPLGGVADTALLKPDNLKPATDMAASGAFIEPTIVDRIDTAHPAVDNEPRKGVAKVATLIEFNDPHLSGQEAVEANLKAAK